MATPEPGTRSDAITSAFEDAANFVKTNKITAFNITPNALRLLYDTYHLTISEIANLLSCHNALISRKLKRAHVTTPLLPLADIRPSLKWAGHRQLREGHRESFEIGRAFIEKHQLDPTNLTSEHLEFLYHELRLPTDVIGELIGRSSTLVRLRMRELGIERRNVGEARTGRYNVNFFKQWSPEMAWVTGLLFTDGCMHRSQVTLASTDMELLQKVQALLGSDSALSPNNYKGKRCHVISFGHTELRKDLLELGLAPRKSLIMEFPEVPPKYIRHFIRGCWDGDGGFTDTGGKFCAHYTCGSRTFINRVAIELFNAGVHRTILHKKNSAGDFLPMKDAYGDGPYPLTVYERRQGRAFDLRFSATSQLAPFYEFLYMYVDSSMYLARKHDLLAGYLRARR